MSTLRHGTRSLLLRIPKTHVRNNGRGIHLAVNPPAFPVGAIIPSILSSFPTITSTLIPIFTGLWDSILRAVPKKKVTHAQKRKRQLAPSKVLKDKKNLTRCEACGDWKLLHTLCESCAKSIQRDWRMRERIDGV